MTYQLPDFDALLELAQRDPDALDALKQEATEAVISSACIKNQRRLHGLQFQIDMEIRRSKTPMESCIKVSKMMHDRLWDLRAALHPEHEVISRGSTDQAKILPFQN